MPLHVSTSKRSHLNLTPMIDVLFLLIIFFMVGAKFSELESTIDVRVPTAQGAVSNGEPARAKQVTLLADGRIMLEGAELSDADLKSQLATLCGQHPDLAVIIRGDANARLQRVVEVMNTCRSAGVLQQGIAFLPVGGG